MIRCLNCKTDHDSPFNRYTTKCGKCAKAGEACLVSISEVDFNESEESKN